MADYDEDKMTNEEVGQKGGETTAEKKDSEFYKEIGRKGGQGRADDSDVPSGEQGNMGGEAQDKQTGEDDDMDF